jgi:streptogramin lyase
MKPMRQRLQPSLSTLAYRAVCVVLGTIAALSLALLAGARADAAPVVDGTFDLSGNAQRIALGPDGNMWMTLASNNEVARITPAGVVTEFDNDSLTGAIGIVTGPDGKLWVTLSTKVVRFDPANPTAPGDPFAADIVQPQTIVNGPDGNLWTASADKVLRITPAGVATPFTVLTGARGIASAGGLLWVADFGAQEIVSVTTDGVPTRYPVGPGGPQEVAAGLGGQVGFTNPGARAGRLVAGGSPLQTDTAPISDPFGIAFGADAAYWFAQPFRNNLGRLTTDGAYTELADFGPSAGPRYVAAGPGNTLWVALQGLGGVDAKKVARVSGLEPPTPTTTPDPPATPNVAPAISGLSVTPKRFRVAKAPTAVVARTVAGGASATARKGKRGKVKPVPAGTAIRFTLSETATVKLTIERKAAGRKSGGKCVKPTRALRSAKRCARYVKAGTLTRRELVAGKQAVKFSGRIGRRALPAGSYRLTVVASDAGSLESKPRTAKFTVASPK